MYDMTFIYMCVVVTVLESAKFKYFSRIIKPSLARLLKTCPWLIYIVSQNNYIHNHVVDICIFN